MGVKLIVPAATTPFTLNEAKAHLRVSHTDDDAIISALITSSTLHAEAFTGRALCPQTWDLYLDSFPTGEHMEIKIPKPPLIEVLSVSYDDADGLPQDVPPQNYYVDTVSEPGWVVPAGGVPWPAPLDAINSVRVRFRAGYLDVNSPTSVLVPGDVCAAIKLILGTLYEQRESQAVGDEVFQLPWGAEQLLRQHRVLLGMA